MAPERLKRNLPYLYILSKAKKAQRNALINSATRDLILCLCDCCHNFLNENVPFDEDQIRKLYKYKNQIRYLGRQNNKDSLNKKKAVIEQNGGFLPLLLTPILTIAGNLLADIITGK